MLLIVSGFYKTVYTRLFFLNDLVKSYIENKYWVTKCNDDNYNSLKPKKLKNVTQLQVIFYHTLPLTHFELGENFNQQIDNLLSTLILFQLISQYTFTYTHSLHC
jgi:hypothetical protein